MKSLALGKVGKYYHSRLLSADLIQFYQVLCICCTVVLPQPQPEIKQGIAGIDRIDVLCSITIDYLEERVDIMGSYVFWIINGSVYGILQVLEASQCAAAGTVTSIVWPFLCYRVKWMESHSSVLAWTISTTHSTWEE